MGQFDKLTARARKALSLAQDEATRLNHLHIGTEHLLLGLVRVNDDVAGQVLESLGVSLHKVRSAVELTVGHRETPRLGQLNLTPRAKMVLELAIAEGTQLQQPYIGTEHLLLGILRQGEGVAIDVLRGLSVDLERIQAKSVEFISPEAESHGEAHIEGQPSLKGFGERARNVLQLAREEAERFNHNYIGTEHLLLGLVRDGDGVAARVLNNMGVQLPKVRSAVEFIIGRGARESVGKNGLTPRAKRVLELAMDERRRLDHDIVGTEHLLLGLVREGEGIAAGVLASLGVNLDKVRAHVMAVLEGKPLPAASYSAKRFVPRLDQVSGRTLTLLGRAHEEAGQLDHQSVMTMHLLLALLREESSPTAWTLSDQVQRRDEIRQEIAGLCPSGSQGAKRNLRLSDDVIELLEYAYVVAAKRHRGLATPEDVLMALAICPNAENGNLMNRLSIDFAEIQARAIECFGEWPAEQSK